MQRMARQNQPLLQFPAPSVLDVFQIAMFGRAVNFVTQDGMSQVRQMHAYLVHASRFRNAPDQRQGAPACIPCPFFPENGSACFSGWVHGLFDPYAAFRDFPLS